MNMCEKSLFLRAKTTIILFMILLSASSDIVAAARTSPSVTPRIQFETSTTYATLTNRPIQPAGPYPCSYLPGDTQCKPPKIILLVEMVKPLFQGSKATILLVLLILAAIATLVMATRPSSPMTRKTRFGAGSMFFPQDNRPVQPSDPNPCSYLPGPGQCKPPPI
ncbi:hypothetical protein SADUNF_Sadunf06G0210400 [Salix dunnii]|uniref:Uncharacterized protein n=1 Tax=Salix dunnii TaxID=1413687 RepID=A0A835MXV9_9ROSI|nr:hypothetical protein SADUNF_Sadunf06G0210400 [Salix dunnii]